MAIVTVSNLSASAASSSRINLSWTNGQSYIGIEVQRSPNGSTWSLLDTISGTATAYSDTSCQDGTKYYYRLQVAAGEESDFSNTANATTILNAPSGLSGTSQSGGTQCVLTWNDNCQNETGFKVYKNGTLLATLGANVETYTATGLTPGVTYSFYVKAYNSAITSAASNTETITMADPPATPSGLTATAIGADSIQLGWTDNADNELDQKIERSATSASAGFSVIATVGANVQSYTDSDSLSSNTQYWYRVRARNASGYSSYSAVATAVTFAAIAAPANLVVVAVSGTVVDLYFQDNSSEEDHHSVEMKTGAGAYGEIVQLEPNRNAYRKTGLTAGTLYTFKLRAYQAPGSYSSYGDEVAVTTPSAPSAPTGLAVSEYQDTWARLTWTAAATATGYKIQYSETDAWGGEEVDVGTIPDDITEFKVPGLTASITYYFRICAYNGAGDSAWTASVSQALRSAYYRSRFERLINRPNPVLTYLVEGNPLIELQGWELSDGCTYAYEVAFDERGAVLDAVYENGVALTELASISAVEAAAGSWWHDTNARKVYVQPSGSDAPSNYILSGSFWVYLTTGRAVDLNGHRYLPLIAQDGIPDITQEIAPYFDTTFSISSGTVSMLNSKILKQHFWDSKFGRYLWLDRKMKILAGGNGFAYSEYEAVNTGIVNGYYCTDQRQLFNLRDYRDGLHKTLPEERFTSSEFALMDENAADRVRQFWYGAVTNVVPVCIDTTNRIFEFHNGPIKSVEYVYQNGTTLTAGTHYFIDYQRGRIILAATLNYASSDIILVDFTGAVTDANETIQTGAHIFKHLMNEFLGVPDSELDLDSIWATHLAETTALSLGLWKETDSQELIRRIERSIQADSFQDAEGRLGLKLRLTEAPSDIIYIPNCYVKEGFEMERSKDSVHSGVNVWYAEDSSQDRYSLVQASSPSMIHLHGARKPLDVYTALTSSSDAATLAADIVDRLGGHPVRLTVPRSLFKAMPGDLFYLTRARYYNQSGTAGEKLMRIISISKGASSGSTSLTAEEVQGE